MTVCPASTSGSRPSGPAPTPVRRVPDALVGGAEVWVKDESTYGDGGWGGNKIRKLEWILPEARRRGTRTIFTVGGIGTHWGLACALYGREQGLRTVLGLVDQPVDDHVREQQRRLRASGADLRYLHTPRRLRLAVPAILARTVVQDRRLPMVLGPGGSSPLGALGYVEAALEIAAQVRAGDLPAPATAVVAVGSGGTAAGLALGFRLAGLDTRVLGVVVNDAVRLDDVTIARLANRTAALLRRRGADLDVGDDPARRPHHARGLAGHDVRRPDAGLHPRGRRRTRGGDGARTRLHGQGAGCRTRPARRRRPPGPGALAEHPRPSLIPVSRPRPAPRARGGPAPGRRGRARPLR